MEKANIHNGFVYGEDLGLLLNKKRMALVSISRS